MSIAKLGFTLRVSELFLQIYLNTFFVLTAFSNCLLYVCGMVSALFFFMYLNGRHSKLIMIILGHQSQGR